MINNMVPILNRSILISKVCTNDNMQTWSHIHVHMDIMEYKVSPHSMVDPNSVVISMSVSIWILWSVDHHHPP